MPMFRFLASLKRLRGTRLDIFGYTEERRMERRLIGEYEATVETLLATLDQNNHALAVQIAALPETHARLRPRQGEEREGGEGARSEPAGRLPQPGPAVGRRGIAGAEQGGTPPLPMGLGREAKASRGTRAVREGRVAAAPARYRPIGGGK